MKFDLQKNKLFLVTLGIVVVIVVVTLVLWRGSVNKLNEASADYETANSDYETLCKNYNGAPCEALQKAYEADLEALKKQATDFVEAVKTEKLNVLDPSNFKIELRKYDNQIKEEREKRNINIYPGEGFSEFLGDVVAKEADMPKLSAQFQTVKDVLGVLLDNDVLEVVSIERNQGDQMSDYDEEEEESFGGASAKKDEKVAKYEGIPVYFQFAIRPDKIYDVLSQLRDKPFFYIVRSIRTDLQPDPVGTVEDPSDILERVTVDMTVEMIKINKPAEAAK
ncbi:Amuc_1100 family pilus-like protein [bacterium]|nr:Amuc_1100 family pilus-like protein [bacterium]